MMRSPNSSVIHWASRVSVSSSKPVSEAAPCATSSQREAVSPEIVSKAIGYMQDSAPSDHPTATWRGPPGLERRQFRRAHKPRVPTFLRESREDSWLCQPGGPAQDIPGFLAGYGSGGQSVAVT